MIYICYVKFNTSLYNVSSDLEGFQNVTGTGHHIAKIREEARKMMKKQGKKGKREFWKAIREVREMKRREMGLW